MRFRAGKRRRSGATVELTPLIDVVLLLLIFLLVTTQFRRDQHAFPIQLPTSSIEQVTVTTDKTTVFVDATGALHLLVVPADAPPGSDDLSQAKAVTAQELEEELRAMHARRPDAPVAIRGEASTSYQAMIDVVAVLERVGFRNIWFPYQLER